MFCLHIFREGGEVLACYIEKKNITTNQSTIVCLQPFINMTKHNIKQASKTYVMKD